MGRLVEGTPHTSHRWKPQQLVSRQGRAWEQLIDLASRGRTAVGWEGGAVLGVAYPLVTGPGGFRMSWLRSQVHPSGPWALPTLPVLTWVLCDLGLLFHLKAR